MARTSTKKKLKPKRCTTEGCRRKPAPNRCLCNPCRSAKDKASDPVRYAYRVWKNNAKRRGKEFDITLEYFREFCYKTEYMTGKGRTKESLHIDRVIESKGYVKGNIRTLKNEKNVKKYMSYAYGPKGKPEHFRVVKMAPLDEEDYPF